MFNKLVISILTIMIFIICPIKIKAIELAPNFQLQTISGQKISLNDLKGKKVVLNFWAAWCPPCREEIPEIVAFYENNRHLVEILAVHVEHNSNIKEFIQQYQMKFPVVVDRHSLVSSLYRIFVIPTTFIIDENGYIITRHIGPIKKEQLQTYINE